MLDIQSLDAREMDIECAVNATMAGTSAEKTADETSDIKRKSKPRSSNSRAPDGNGESTVRQQNDCNESCDGGIWWHLHLFEKNAAKPGSYSDLN